MINIKNHSNWRVKTQSMKLIKIHRIILILQTNKIYSEISEVIKID